MPAAIAATARRLPRAEPALLGARVASSVVLAPLPVAAVWFGSPWLPLLTAFAAAVMAWEWGRLCRSGAPPARLSPVASRAPPGHRLGHRAQKALAERFSPVVKSLGVSGAMLVAVVLAAVAMAALGSVEGALAIVWCGVAAVFWAAHRGQERAPRWLACGALWVALPCIALLWLAQVDRGGRSTLLWILAVVWATDIGAFVIGRRLGGPRLAPRWSPRKTWAGLAGGAGCAAAVGWVTARWLGIAPALPLVALSAALAIVEQFGDLAESVAKRRFGVKDSSGLIPGHGGLLDRLDGFLAVVPTVALLTLFGGGSVLTWQ